MRLRWITAIAVAAVTAATAGCSMAPPAQRALSESRTIVASGVEAGASWPDDAESIEVRARYNPCRCAAPPFEVLAYGSWQRVVLGGNPEQIGQLRGEAETLGNTRGLDFLWLEGRFDGSARYEETGLRYDRFELTDYRVESDRESSESGGE